MGIGIVDRARTTLAEAIRSRVAGPNRQERADLIWRSAGERWFGNDDPIAIVNGNPTMYIGGIRALLLQSLHPLAMAGVAGHSGYQDDPWGRLQRTADYIATTTFAPIEHAEKMIARVRKIHTYITGTLPDGRPYAASDPHLLLWVHCAEIESFLVAYQQFGPTTLTPEQADTYVAQTAVSARLLGVVDPPTTVDELYATLASYGHELEFSESTQDVVDLLIHNPPLDPPMKWGYDMLKFGAIAILPASARELLGLPASDVGDALVRRPITSIGMTGLRWSLGAVRLSGDAVR